MNAQPTPFFTSPRCEVLKPNEALSDIQERVHRNNGSHKKEPVEARARAWMDKHPHVYDEFREFALVLCERYDGHIGGRLIAERVRYERKFNGGEDFKLNDNVTPYMVRRFIAEYPRYADRFELRGRKGTNHEA